jgi:glycerol-3-phosphate cytidylyltransferase
MRVGFTCGAFDLFHAGHHIFLRDAKEHCDYLIVGLHTDPTIDRPQKNKPIQTIYERYTQLKNSAWVDEIIPYDTETDLLNVLATNKIDVRFLGSDYLHKSFTGDDFCQTINMEIMFINRLHDFSSSELRKRLLDDTHSTKPLFVNPPSKSSLF